MQAIPTDRDPAGSFGQRPVTTVDDRILQGSWKTRARGMWAGGYLGLLTGLALGAGIAFIPFLVIGGSIFGPPVLSAVALCMATVGAIGAGMGMAGGAAVGESAGPVASGVKEILRQQNEQFSKLAAQIRGVSADSPALAEAANATTTAASLPMTDPAAKTGLAKYLNLKTGLTFIALGAIAGALLSFGPLGAGMIGLTAAIYGIPSGLGAAGAVPAAGTAAALISTKALVVMSAAIGGLSGAIFGVNYPIIFNKMSNAFGEMLAGRAPKTTLTPSPALQKVIESPTLTPTVTPEEAALLTARQKERSGMPHVQQLQMRPQTAASGVALS